MSPSVAYHAIRCRARLSAEAHERRSDSSLRAIAQVIRDREHICHVVSHIPYWDNDNAEWHNYYNKCRRQYSEQLKWLKRLSG